MRFIAPHLKRTSVSSIFSNSLWIRVSVYLLFISLPLSIAAMNFSAGLLHLLAIYRYARYRDVTMPPRWVCWPWVLFLLWMIVSALVNPMPWKNLEQILHYWYLFLPFVVLISIKHVRLDNLLSVYAVVTILVASYGLVQHIYGVDWLRISDKIVARPFGSFYHAVGTFSHHMTYGGVMMLNAPLFVSLAIVVKSRRRLWITAAAFSLIAVETSLARNTWLGAFVGVLVLAGFFFKSPKRLLPGIVSLSCFVVLVNALVIAHEFIQSGEFRFPLLERAEVTDLSRDGRDGERRYMWDAAQKHIAENPFFGVGINNHGESLKVFYASIEEKTGRETFHLEPSTGGVHNIYLQMAVNLGVLGAAIYSIIWISSLLWFFLIFFKIPFRSAYFGMKQGALMGLGGSVVAFGIASFFQNHFLDTEVCIAMLSMLGMAWHCGAYLKKNPHSAC